jgi:O-antigen ligase
MEPTALPIPPQYIHLETALLVPFLVLMLWVQLKRARQNVYTAGSVKGRAFGLLGLFGILSAGCTALLYNVSPILGVELGAAFTLSLMHPVTALCFFVHMLFLRPWDIIPNNPLLLALPRAMAVTCFLSWALHPVAHSKPGSRAAKALILLLAFSSWLFLSTFAAPNAAAAQGVWFNMFFKSLVIFTMCAFFIESELSLTQFKNTILFSIFTMAAMGFYQFATSTEETRLAAVTMLDPNDLAAISVIAVPLALSLVFSSRGLLRRVAGLIIFGVCLLAIWYSQSRGALLAVSAQVIIYQVVKSLSQRRLGALVAVACVGFAYIFFTGRLERTEDDLQASRENRMTYWKAAAKMAVSNPLLGVGYEQYPDRYENYATSARTEFGRRTAHSTWLLAFAESGILGGILFIAFFLTVFRTAWRNRKENPDQFYALGGYGVAMSFLSHTYLLFPYLLYGLILATDSVKERRLLES